MQIPVGRLRALAIAVIAATGLLLAGGQLRGCYSGNPAYSAQVDAFLHGHLALADAPEAVQHDFVWTGRDVQQVWGLGVPAWQTPFELAARGVGAGPFPDRLALLAWLVVMIYVAIRAWIRRDQEPAWIGAGCVAIGVLLPAFVTLVRGRVGVYEEAAIYAYAAAIMLLAA